MCEKGEGATFAGVGMCGGRPGALPVPSVMCPLLLQAAPNHAFLYAEHPTMKTSYVQELPVPFALRQPLALLFGMPHCAV